MHCKAFSIFFFSLVMVISPSHSWWRCTRLALCFQHIAHLSWILLSFIWVHFFLHVLTMAIFPSHATLSSSFLAFESPHSLLLLTLAFVLHFHPHIVFFFSHLLLFCVALCFMFHIFALAITHCAFSSHIYFSFFWNFFSSSMLIKLCVFFLILHLICASSFCCILFFFVSTFLNTSTLHIFIPMFLFPLTFDVLHASLPFIFTFHLCLHHNFCYLHLFLFCLYITTSTHLLFLKFWLFFIFVYFFVLLFF